VIILRIIACILWMFHPFFWVQVSMHGWPDWKLAIFGDPEPFWKLDIVDKKAMILYREEEEEYL